MPTKNQLLINLADLEQRLATTEATPIGTISVARLGEVVGSKSLDGIDTKRYSHRRKGYSVSISKDGKFTTRKASDPEDALLIESDMRAHPTDYL